MTKIIASLTAMIAMLLAFLGMPSITDTDIKPNAWMANIDDSAYISEISIPGTHDSGALYEPVQPSAKCQDYTIKDQLNMGVRFLDMRCNTSLGKFIIVHGVVYQGISFDDVLSDCYTFLKENPSETIVMSVKQGEESLNITSVFTKMLKEYISDNADMWYTENVLPQLGDVRGKIVLFNRYDADSELGLNCTAWPNNTMFTINNDGYNVHIQDYYSMEDTAVEWGYITELLDACYNETDREHNLYVNFLSGLIKKGLFPDPPVVANTINPLFTEYMNSAPKGCYGIVLFDFVTPELCDLLISKNF